MLLALVVTPNKSDQIEESYAIMYTWIMVRIYI